MLEGVGFEVLVATSGPDALRKAWSQPVPDLILLDIVMPSMDGFEVCRHLKTNPVSQSIPVIFISAIGVTEQKLEAFRAGAVDYINKPFHCEEVVARVESHLQLVTIKELQQKIVERQFAVEALKSSQAKLAALTAELGLTEERERRRIALALHDKVVQDLALGKLKLDQAIKKGLLPASSAIVDLQELLADSMTQLRHLCSDLSPRLLYDVGLKEAVESLGERLSQEFGFSFSVTGDDAIRLQEGLQVTLFQIVRELLINVVKHAEASTVTVQISLLGGLVGVEVADDGVGFEFTPCQEGFGLANIRQRVSFLDGTFHTFTATGRGTRVVIEIPVNDLNKGVPDDSENSAG